MIYKKKKQLKDHSNAYLCSFLPIHMNRTGLILSFFCVQRSTTQNQGKQNQQSNKPCAELQAAAFKSNIDRTYYL